jgi:hypothetical protein
VAVAAAVALRERALQLDPEPLGAERAQQPPPHRRGAGVVAALDASPHRALARAAGQAHEPLGVALHVLESDGRLRGGLRRARRAPLARAAVRLRDQQAQVAVAGRALAQEREVRAVVERQLGPCERPDAERLCGLRKLHRAVQAVVVGERDRRVALLGCGARELYRMRRTVEK